MNKVTIYLLDTNKYSFEELSESSYLSFDILTSILRMKNEVAKKEKAASNILKNKRVGAFTIDKSGKPVSDKCFFNVSHDNGIVALVKSDIQVGIDLEQLRKIDTKLLNYAFTYEERKIIKSSKAFFAVWTNKESLLKCDGIGLRMKMSEVPGLPVNGVRVFKDSKYYSRTINHRNCIISVTIKKPEKFDIEIVDETLS